jgi:hypothetical protein
MTQMTREQAEIADGEFRICSSSPPSDLVGTPCSNCGHAGHWLVECQGCKIDIRLVELDDLIARYKALLAEGRVDTPCINT